MRYVLTTEQMREADTFTVQGLGVPTLELMERAGAALKKEAERLAPTGRILIVCGGGNNGGDGFVCGRLLLASGREVDAVFFAELNVAHIRTFQDKAIISLPFQFCIMVN